MALFILTPGLQPLGDFDVDDTDGPNILGGEVMALDEASTSVGTDKAASDVFDGYIADQIDVGTSTATRVVARLADEATSTEPYNMFYLADEGKKFYGVTFGTVIGSPTGLSTTSTSLGPHTTSGSGKVTLWHLAGLYAVSTDALSTDVVPTTAGTNKYDTPLPGQLLYREGSTGKLCRATTSSDKIATFIELTSNGSLVTTPARLVGGAATADFDRIKIYYLGSSHNA